MPGAQRSKRSRQNAFHQRVLLLITLAFTAAIWSSSATAAQALFFNRPQRLLLDMFPSGELAVQCLFWGFRGLFLLYILVSLINGVKWLRKINYTVDVR